MLGVGFDQIVHILSSLERRGIEVHPRQCSRVRHRRSSCTLCADYCPLGAITWGESLQVDPSKCTGCGICGAVCPTGALEARAPTNAELLAQIQELVKQSSAIAFACPRYFEARDEDSRRFIPVNCLGRLDESLLVGAVSLGAEALWLVDGACEGCPNAAPTQAAQRANSLLQAFGVEPRIFIGPDLPEGLSTAVRPSRTGQALSRRAFFSLLARRTTGAAASAATATVDSIFGNEETRPQEDQRPKKAELPVHLPLKRRLLLAALRRIGKPLVASCAVDGGPWAQFGFEESCTGCQMCAFFCPSGALTKIEKDGKAGVVFRISFCTNCRLCQDVCYKEALLLSSDFDPSKVLEDAVETFLMRDLDATPWHALANR